MHQKNYDVNKIDVNDIVGKKFGSLTVVSYAGREYDEYKNVICRRHYYLCKCDCGNEKRIRRCSLIYGLSKSCGCAKKHK